MERVGEKEEEGGQKQGDCRDPASLLTVALLRQPLDEVSVLHAVDLASRLDERLSHHGG